MEFFQEVWCLITTVRRFSSADTCSGRCGQSVDSTKSCQCNEQCASYGDCCPDYVTQCNSGGGNCGRLTRLALVRMNIYRIIPGGEPEIGFQLKKRPENCYYIKDIYGPEFPIILEFHLTYH